MPTREKREKRWTDCPLVLDPHSLLLCRTYTKTGVDRNRALSSIQCPFRLLSSTEHFRFHSEFNTRTRQLPSFIRSLSRYLRISNSRHMLYLVIVTKQIIHSTFYYHVFDRKIELETKDPSASYSRTQSLVDVAK